MLDERPMQSTNSSLHQALCCESGIVSAIGAGGKKTTLFALLAQSSVRTALTCSTFTPTFPPLADTRIHIADTPTLRERLASDASTKIAYGLPTDKPRRVGPLDTAAIVALHAAGGFALTLVKADGARMRRIKAPAEHEPSVVPGSTVLAISAILAVGRRLDEGVAHRPERISAITGLALGETISASTIARLYTRAGGLTHNTSTGPLIAVLNMVDDATALRHASACAREILADSERITRVVLLSQRRSGSLVDVIER